MVHLCISSLLAIAVIILNLNARNSSFIITRWSLVVDVVISKLCFISGPPKEKKQRTFTHCLKKIEHAFFVGFFSNNFGVTKNFIMNHIENYLDLVVYTFFGWLNYDIYLSDNDKTSPLMINCMLVYFYATLVSMSDSNITNLQHGEYQCL